MMPITITATLKPQMVTGIVFRCYCMSLTHNSFQRSVSKSYLGCLSPCFNAGTHHHGC
ncbi:hypothetical protein Hanom_Chr11g00980301 [Helianthus anomalus]